MVCQQRSRVVEVQRRGGGEVRVNNSKRKARSSDRARFSVSSLDPKPEFYFF
jgi:hypothetical protein